MIKYNIKKRKNEEKKKNEGHTSSARTPVGQKSRLHLLRISVFVFGSLVRVFAHSSSLISCKDEVEMREGIEYSYIGKIFHDKTRKEGDGSPNPFATGTVVDIMRIVDEEDLHLYFKCFNHEATDGKQPTDSKEDEDKWAYTGCIEMIERGRCLFYVASFASCCS